MKRLTLGEIKRRLQKLTQAKLEQATQEIILKDPKILERKKDELKSGIRPDGSIIGEYRSEKYKLFKQKLNPLAGGKVDLILKGDTKRGLYLESDGKGGFIFRSSDSKWDDLMAKYNKGQIGSKDLKAINPQVFDRLQKFVYHPELIVEMKKISGL